MSSCLSLLLPLAGAYTVSYWHPAGTRCEEGDVNALFEYRGTWHLFHQFRNRPRTSIGHHSSTDLLRWAQLSDALESGNATDEQCYDGGASLVPHPTTGAPVPMLMIDGGCARKGKPGPSCMESSGDNTGGVIAFPSDPSDPNLTHWDRQGPTKWEPCNSSAWPSPIWLNPVTKKYNLVAVHGFGEARFEAEDASFTKWKLADPAFFSGVRGLGGGMWHAIPPNVDGVHSKPWATHIVQGALGHAFNGLPNFIMGVYDPKAQTFTNISKPMLIDAGGGVDYGQLSWQQNTKKDGRCLFVSWLRLTEPGPPDCGTQGQLTAIRDLRYDPRLDRLVHLPIAEYYQLRSSSALFSDKQLKLQAGAAPTILYGGKEGIAMDAEFNISVPLDSSAMDVQFGLRCFMHLGAYCTEGVNITLQVASPHADGGRQVTMHVDYKYHVTVAFPLLAGESVLPLRVLSDLRSLEIFAGFGRGVVSITMLSEYGVVTAASAAAPPTLVSAAAWALSL